MPENIKIEKAEPLSQCKAKQNSVKISDEKVGVAVRWNASVQSTQTTIDSVHIVHDTGR